VDTRIFAWPAPGNSEAHYCRLAILDLARKASRQTSTPTPKRQATHSAIERKGPSYVCSSYCNTPTVLETSATGNSSPYIA
jgi:hypothetical protein